MQCRIVHLYEEIGRLHVWKWHLEVLDNLDVTSFIDTDGFDFCGIGHEIAELVDLYCREQSSDCITHTIRVLYRGRPHPLADSSTRLQHVQMANIIAFHVSR